MADVRLHCGEDLEVAYAFGGLRFILGIEGFEPLFGRKELM